MSEEDINEANDEMCEPEIFSENPSERKLARQLRIQRRLDAMRKQHLQEEGIEVPDNVGKTLLEDQVEQSADQLEKLLLEGKELVTNVRVANDTREVQRREHEDEARVKRLQMLEDEAAASMATFEAISSKWEQISSSSDPLDIFHDMEAQKVQCRELIDQKSKLIEELRKKIVLVDEHFDKDQRKQKEDLSLIAERIDNQVNVMRRAYRQELQLMEHAVSLERKQQIEAGNKKWESLYKEREKEEVVNMNKKFDQVDELHEEIHLINIDHQEKYRAIKIRLETDLQVLHQELEQVKALCLLNSEKLDYNFQVLKKRDEENVLIKAQQKRRINKLQDAVNSLCKKIKEIQVATESEQARLTDEVVRLHHNILNIEKKANHFSAVNDKIYHQVWELNHHTASNLLNKILTTDQLIYEQQLGLDWTPPEQKLYVARDLVSYQTAMQVVQDLFKKNKGEEENVDNYQFLLPMQPNPQRQRSEERLLRHILQLVADNAGFLIEERVFGLLYRYPKKEKTLVKLDHVFSALGIKSEDDVLVMRNFFLPYTYCRSCSSVTVPKVVKLLTAADEVEEVEIKSVVMFPEDISGKKASVSSFDEDHTQGGANMYSDTVNWDTPAVGDALAAGASSTSGPMGTVKSDDTRKNEKNGHNSVFSRAVHRKSIQFKSKCTPDHIITIDPIHVLKALRDFISHLKKGKNTTISNMSSRLAMKRSTVSRLLASKDVNKFWACFCQIFSPEREKLWDGLYVGLQKYHAILEDRQRLNNEAEKLRSQNAELRRLLETYTSEMANSKRTRSLYRPKPNIKMSKH